MAEKKMKLWHWLVLLLLVAGGLNWGTIGIWNYDFVQKWFGFIPILPMLIKDLIGVSAIITLGYFAKEELLE